MKFLFLLSLIFLPASQDFLGVYVIKDDLETYDLTDQVLLFYDETGELKPGEISALPLNNFEANLYFDSMHGGAVWGRLEIKNLSGKRINRTIKYCENSAAVATYIGDEEGVSSAMIFGNFASLVPREESDIRTIPILSLEHNESVIIIYRLYSHNTTSIIHPYELRLVSANHFIGSNTVEMILIGGLLGVLILMVILTITFFVIFRDKNLIYFSGVLFGFLIYFLVMHQLPERIFQLSGLFSYAISGASETILLLSFSALSSSLFKLKSHYKFLYKLLWGLSFFFTLIFFLRLGFHPVFKFRELDNIIIMAWIVSHFGGTIFFAIKRKPDAVMFFFSTFILTIGTSLFTLTEMALIPSTFIGTHGMQLGIIGFSITIMFTLWKRVKRIQTERANSQALSLSLAKENEQLVINQNIVLESEILKRTAELRKEKDASEKLLLNILPEEIAKELKETGEAEAKSFSQVSVLFTDFKGFTKISEKLTAKALVAEINYCFKAFDRICEKCEVEKIKTIGDAYMATGGLPVPSKDSAKNIVIAAIQMTEFMLQRKKEREASGQLPFEMTAGVHTGPVVAGIVGVKKFQYDIWGDTVNTASRMESHGEVGRVNISQTTYELLKNEPQLKFEHRGKLEVKSKGKVHMYFVKLA